MFVSQGRETGHLPAYTGHVPQRMEEEIGIGHRPPQSQIPGYKGYIPGVKSENLFGTTYGKITYSSATGDYPKGLDHPPTKKYVSMARDQHIDLSTVKEKPATEQLGLPQPETAAPTVIPVKTLNAFMGVEDPDTDKNANVQNFFGFSQNSYNEENKGNDYEINMRKFYGQEKREKPIKHGTPIPGYTGVARRVEANNIFGVTYANSLKLAKGDLKEKKEEDTLILHQRAIYTPDYRA